MAKFVLKWGRWSLDLDAQPRIMGVINVTPDSFSDGGDFFSPATAIDQGKALVLAGADMLDIGGESTRPGSKATDANEEIGRVVPVIEALARQVQVPICVDTNKAAVAEKALESGASMINDVSAGRFDPDILRVAADADVPLILMHMKGKPRTMQEKPVYNDLLGEIKSFLADAANRAEAVGVAADKIIIDPGIGFGKTFDHNLILINRLEEFAELNMPLLIGASRKAFLGEIIGGAPAKELDIATTAITALSIYKGAHIVRVHDAALARQTRAVVTAVKRETIL